MAEQKVYSQATEGKEAEARRKARQEAGEASDLEEYAGKTIRVVSIRAASLHGFPGKLRNSTYGQAASPLKMVAKQATMLHQHLSNTL